jgi:hypothetical protein
MEFPIQFSHVCGIGIRIDAIENFFGLRKVSISHSRNGLTQGSRLEAFANQDDFLEIVSG